MANNFGTHSTYKINRLDGKTAEGAWVNGVQHGTFKMTVPKKGIYTCVFENGQPNKSGGFKKYVSRKSQEPSPKS